MWRLSAVGCAVQCWEICSWIERWCLSCVVQQRRETLQWVSHLVQEGGIWSFRKHRLASWQLCVAMSYLLIEILCIAVLSVLSMVIWNMLIEQSKPLLVYVVEVAEQLVCCLEVDVCIEIQQVVQHNMCVCDACQMLSLVTLVVMMIVVTTLPVG